MIELVRLEAPFVVVQVRKGKKGIDAAVVANHCTNQAPNALANGICDANLIFSVSRTAAHR